MIKNFKNKKQFYQLKLSCQTFQTHSCNNNSYARTTFGENFWCIRCTCIAFLESNDKSLEQNYQSIACVECSDTIGVHFELSLDLESKVCLPQVCKLQDDCHKSKVS